MSDFTAKPTTKRPRKMAREPEPTAASVGTTVATASKSPSKTCQVLELLKRDHGATIEELVSMTGWLPHTTRAALTGLKKKGHALTSEKIDSVRRYRVVGGAA
jgi:hypothetical protein